MNGTVFVVDTNVLLTTADFLSEFKDVDLVIPFRVLEELDDIKTRRGKIGADSRRAVRKIEEIVSDSDLFEGATNPYGSGTVKLAKVPAESASLPGLTISDNHILLTALSLRWGADVCVLTNDICLRAKCAAYGISSRAHEGRTSSSDGEALPVAEVTTSVLEINAFYRDEDVFIDGAGLFPNQFVHLRSIESGKVGALARYQGDHLPLLRVIDKHSELERLGFRPRNREQVFLMDLLMDPEVKVVTVTGMAGTGKSICVTGAALAQIPQGLSKRSRRDPSLYNSLIVSRPIQAMGADIGFLPGTKDEKLLPWIQPIVDSFEVILGDREVFDLYREGGLVQIEAPTHIRGRSISNSFMLIDEAQNLSPHEIKTIITRVGEGTKIVFTGDVEQIDRHEFNDKTNGLSYLVDCFKDSHLHGHVTLSKGERSEVAEYAAKVMQ